MGVVEEKWFQEGNGRNDNGIPKQTIRMRYIRKVIDKEETDEKCRCCGCTRCSIKIHIFAHELW